MSIEEQIAEENRRAADSNFRTGQRKRNNDPNTLYNGITLPEQRNHRERRKKQEVLFFKYEAAHYST